MSDVSGFLTSEQKPDRPSVSRRFGTVLAVNAGPPLSVDVELAVSGITIPAVPCLTSYVPLAGDSVVVDFTHDTPLAIGATDEESGWHLVGGSGEPVFANSWVNFDAGYAPARFCKIGGVVHVQGLVKSGTVGAAAFTLPAGYRPSLVLMFAVNSQSAHARLDVEADGDVVIKNGAATPTDASINCSFPAEA